MFASAFETLGGLENGLRCLFIVLIFLLCFLLGHRVGLLALDNKYRDSVILLYSERHSTSPAGTMLKTSLRWSLTTILGQQQEQNFPSCMEYFSHSWSDVAFDTGQGGGRDIEHLLRHELKIVNVSLCFLFCTSPLAVPTVADIFVKSHASLRAHLFLLQGFLKMCCPQNFGAHGLRS